MSKDEAIVILCKMLTDDDLDLRPDESEAVKVAIAEMETETA